MSETCGPWIGLSATSAGTVKSETRGIYVAGTGTIQSKACGILRGKYGDGKVRKLVWTLQEDLWRDGH